MVNATWYPTGGDWTYIESINKIYTDNNHKIIPFSTKNEKNKPSIFEKYFIEGIDYKVLNQKKTIANGVSVLKNAIYSVEAKEKIRLLLNDFSIDIAQLNNIHNIQTPSIIKEIKRKNIPIVWRVLDYKLLCPNRTFLSGNNLCQACFKHKYYNCVLKKCKKNSYSASIIAALESYYYWLKPFKKDIDTFLFQNDFMKELFIKFGYDKSQCLVVENPYDWEQSIPKYKGEDYILYFGRISEEKGIMTLLKAMSKLPDVKLKIVGYGPLEKEALSFVSQQKMENVLFLGPQYGDSLNDILSKCLFVVLPSEWYEPSPYAVLQAYAMGKAVLVNKIGGLTNLVIDRYSGLHSKPFNFESLAQCISEMVEKKEATEEMGKNARKILENNHSSVKYYNVTMDLFNKLLESKMQNK